MKNLLSPQLLAHQGERIGEGRMSLVVPGRPPKGARCLPHPAMGEQGDEREQTQQRRGGPSYCQVRPLPLRLETEMPTHLLECRLQLPAHDEPGEDLLRIGVKVSTQKGLG